MSLLAKIENLPPEKRLRLEAEAAAARKRLLWAPMVDMDDPARPTPQRLAYDSLADITLYGGAAGGGKTDLLAGLALTQHRRSIIFRREHAQLGAIIERITNILGGRQGFTGQPYPQWHLGERYIRLGGMQHLGDETAYQGQPFDFMGFDELAQFLERQFRYVQAWNRSVSGQRCRIVGATNPPGTPVGDDAAASTSLAESEWLIQYWAPWLDPQHPSPAQSGELRWYITDRDGKDQAVVDGTPQRVSWDPNPVVPRSRTFIPSNVDDNPYLVMTGYKATLQGMPEPLRSQLLKGDFTAGRGDSPWQVIPSEWVKMAQARWRADGKPRTKMTAIGVDVARGGRDHTVLSPRYGHWFAEQLAYPGKDTPEAPVTASLVVAAMRDGAQANIDAVGVGGEVLGHLRATGCRVCGIYSGAPSEAHDRTGAIGFFNKRSEMWWKFREALDPASGEDIALPPSRALYAALCAPRWSLAGRGIKVETKDETIKRLGRSPDEGDAAIYAFAASPMPQLANVRPKVGVV